MNKLINVKYESRPKLSLKLNRLTKMPRLIGSPIAIRTQSETSNSSQSVNGGNRTPIRYSTQPRTSEESQALTANPSQNAELETSNMMCTRSSRTQPQPNGRTKSCRRIDMSLKNSKSDAISSSEHAASSTDSCVHFETGSHESRSDVTYPTRPNIISSLANETSRQRGLRSNPRVLNASSKYQSNEMEVSLVKSLNDKKRTANNEKHVRVALKMNKNRLDKRSLKKTSSQSIHHFCEDERRYKEKRKKALLEGTEFAVRKEAFFLCNKKNICEDNSTSNNNTSNFVVRNKDHSCNSQKQRNLNFGMRSTQQKYRIKGNKHDTQESPVKRNRRKSYMGGNRCHTWESLLKSSRCDTQESSIDGNRRDSPTKNSRSDSLERFLEGYRHDTRESPMETRASPVKSNKRKSSIDGSRCDTPTRSDKSDSLERFVKGYRHDTRESPMETRASPVKSNRRKSSMDGGTQESSIDGNRCDTPTKSDKSYSLERFIKGYRHDTRESPMEGNRRDTQESPMETRASPVKSNKRESSMDGGTQESSIDGSRCDTPTNSDKSYSLERFIKGYRHDTRESPMEGNRRDTQESPMETRASPVKSNKRESSMDGGTQESSIDGSRCDTPTNSDKSYSLERFIKGYRHDTRESPMEGNRRDTQESPMETRASPVKSNKRESSMDGNRCDTRESSIDGNRRDTQKRRDVASRLESQDRDNIETRTSTSTNMGGYDIENVCDNNDKECDIKDSDHVGVNNGVCVNNGVDGNTSDNINDQNMCTSVQMDSGPGNQGSDSHVSSDDNGAEETRSDHVEKENQSSNKKSNAVVCQGKRKDTRVKRRRNEASNLLDDNRLLQLDNYIPRIDDFKPRRSKRTRSNIEYLKEEEELQLALAVSASLYYNTNGVQLPPINNNNNKKKKAVKSRSKAMIPPPLLLTTFEEATARLMIKAHDILTCDDREDEIPLTQAIAPSTLGILATTEDREGPPVEREGPPVEREGPLLEKERPLVEREGSPVEREGPPVEREGPLVEREGSPVEREGPPVEREGPLVEREGPPVEREGPPVEREGSPVEREGPPVEREGPHVEREGPPVEREGSPVEREGPPVEREGPHVEREGPLLEREGPLLEREGPPVERERPLVEREGPPVEREGPPVEREGPLVEREGSPVEREGPPVEREGPLVEREGPPVEREGPLVEREGPLVEREGPPVEREGSHVEREGPLLEREGPPVEKEGPLVEREGSPVERKGSPVEREVPPVEREGPLLEREGPPVEREIPHVEREVPPVEREGPPVVVSGNECSMIGLPNGVVSPVLNYKTMWKLSAYTEQEPVDEFYVQMLSQSLIPQINRVKCMKCTSNVLSTDDHGVASQQESNFEVPMDTQATQVTLSHLTAGDDEESEQNNDDREVTATRTQDMRQDVLVAIDNVTRQDNRSPKDNTLAALDEVSTNQEQRVDADVRHGGTEVTSGNVSANIVKLSRDMQLLFQSELFSDLSVTTANGTTVSAHRGILCCRCPSMTSILTASNDGLLDLSAFSHDSVKLFLQYIYTGTIQLPTNNGGTREELLTMADLWNVEEVFHIIQNADKTNKDDVTCDDGSAPYESRSPIVAVNNNSQGVKGMDCISDKTSQVVSTQTFPLDLCSTGAQTNDYFPALSTSRSSANNTSGAYHKSLPFASSTNIAVTAPLDSHTVTQSVDNTSSEQTTCAITIESKNNTPPDIPHLTPSPTLTSQISHSTPLLSQPLSSPPPTHSPVPFTSSLASASPSQSTNALPSHSQPPSLVHHIPFMPSHSLIVSPPVNNDTEHSVVCLKESSFSPRVPSESGLYLEPFNPLNSSIFDTPPYRRNSLDKMHSHNINTSNNVTNDDPNESHYPINSTPLTSSNECTYISHKQTNAKESTGMQAINTSNDACPLTIDTNYTEIIYVEKDCYSPYPQDTAQEIVFPASSFSQSITSDSDCVKNIRVVQATPTNNKTQRETESSPLVVSDKNLVTPVLNRTTEGIVNTEVSVAMEVSIFSEEIDLYQEHDSKDNFLKYTPCTTRSSNDLLLSDDNITPMPSYRTMATPSCTTRASNDLLLSDDNITPMPSYRTMATPSCTTRASNDLLLSDDNITPMPSYRTMATPSCTTRASNDLLLSDDNITPMPSYRTMATPSLKEACSSYGIRPLAKSKMIAKLEEIYEYTHPLVDDSNNIVAKASVKKRQRKGKVTRKKGTTASDSNTDQDKDRPLSVVSKEKDLSFEQLMESVSRAIKQNAELYQSIVLFKPLELIYIQQTLKNEGLSVSREKLAEVLDKLSVTFTVPRTR